MEFERTSDDGQELKPLIVVSGINIFQGGMLTIYRECLRELNNSFASTYRIHAYVHQISLFENSNYENIKFFELPKSRKKWLYRVYYEYIFFRQASKKKKPFLWLSLHDTSPFLLNTQKQCVYCHNPSVFHKTKLKVLYYDRTHFLFTLFYKFLYQINIKKNDYIIVQQDWIRQNFKKYYGLPLRKILVSYPGSVNMPVNSEAVRDRVNSRKIFFYPAFPRTFKNFEVVVEAVRRLEAIGLDNFQVNFTITGNENLYAKWVKKISSGLLNIHFLGKLSLEEVQTEYQITDILIFPSTLETWGLPLSEFKGYGKPILAADLPYAHETIGNYDRTHFFNPSDAVSLANKMAQIIKDDTADIWKPAVMDKPASPFTDSWQGMLDFILTK